MKNKFSKMMFTFLAALALSVSTVSATWVNVQVTPGSWAGEISWSLNDASTGTSVGSQLAGYYSMSNVAIDTWVNATDGCYNMELYDSYGDGWNGGTYQIIDSAGTVYSSGGLLSGNFGLDNVNVNGTCTLGCTDPTATNYNSAAVWDDGTCTFPCIAADTTESFEAGFSAWANDAANTLDWTIHSGGTSSGLTGPTAAFDGLSYIYTETSGGSNKTATVSVGCVDMSGWTSPAFVMAYHMYGATMGTVNVDVSTDGGATWTNEWTLSGDQGNQWAQAIVDLSAYTGQIAVRIQALTGTSYTSDMAVDLLQFMEMPTIGCTDPFASNYNPAASIDDGSCLFPGCLDPLATNYCATCNVNDSLSCIYPVCNTLDFSDDFESANLSGNGWTTLSGTEALVSLTSVNAITDTVSLEFTGGNYVGWNYPYATEADAFGGSPDHVSSATICMDMSGSAATVNMTLDAELVSYFSSTYGWFRVRIAGDTVGFADVAGNGAYNNSTLTGVNTLTYDLSAYANQSQVYITFEAACKYGPAYNGGAYNDEVRIDNINIFNVYPCTYYTASAVGTDASCNTGADGTATCTVSSPNATSDTYLWSDGQTFATATGLAAGTYTCVTTDSINGCTATASVTIGEPAALLLSATTVDIVSPISMNGSVDLSVAGGTPCYVGANTVSGALPNNSYGGNVFNVIASADLGISSLDLFCQAGLGDIDVYYRNGSAEGVELDASAWTHAAYQGNMLNVAGLVNVPVSISASAGDTIGLYVICSNGMQYTSGNAAAYSTIISSDANLAISNGAGLGTYIAFSGSVFGPPNGARDFSGNVNYGTASYTYAWTTGAATEDVSGLGMGPISCTVTDCNGCTATWSGFILVNIVPGCMDALASNYNPAANQSDTSCTYPGCTDSVATNYDASANLDDGSCTYTCAYYGYDDEITITYNSDFYADETSWQIINSIGDTVATSVPYATGVAVYVTTACVYDGCFTIEMQDSYGDGWGFGTGHIMVQNANGDTLVSGATVATGSSATDIFGVNSACIIGCMDATATNFDPAATISDSTLCIFCTDNLLTLNMYDSYGDGWNGNSFVMSDVILGSTVGAATLTAGSAGSEFFCIPDGCYNIVVDYGSYQYEVSWDLVDAAGTIILSGGAPFSGNVTLGATTVCASGCMDPLANNYDSLAILADSCAYVGCLDMTAVNYSPGSNVSDSTLCIYPGCGTSLPYTEDFSSGMGNDLTLGWFAGGSISTVDSTNNGTFSWHGQGDQYLGWNAPYGTGVEAFTYSPTHVASGSLCIDLTAYAGQSILMTFDLRQTFSFNATYSWFRVTDGTNVLSSATGADYYSPATADSDAWYNVSYDLSALAGTQATIVFQSAGKYIDDYYQGGDNSFVDNIDISVAVTPVAGCTDSTASNYNPAANIDDGSCVTCGAGYAYVNINCDNGAYQYEVSWDLVDAAGITVLSGGAPFNLDTCLADGCYTLDMVDSYGDGWNGNIFSITESMSGVSATATLASGTSGTASLSSPALGCYLYGCTDPLATNYDATANTDDGTCAYAMCATVYPFTEDFESGSSAYLTLTTGGNAGSSIDSNNNVSATSQYTWHGQGGTSAGYLFPYGTGPDAFNSVTHVATGSVCVDLTSFAAGSAVAMSFDLRQEFSFNGTYSWFRVKSDTTVLTSTAGMDYYSPTTACSDVWVNHTYDLSAYAGTTINIDFQSVGKYNDDYYNCGDNSYVDNINIVSAIYGCMDALASNYNPAATASDGSCVYPCHVANGYATGFEDGIAQLALTPADWMQNSDDNVGGHGTYGDWIHDNLGTGSSFTGPNYATNSGGTGNAMEGAYYMFIEASGNYNNNVSMTSHCFDLSTLSNASLKFWYNMYDGSTAGGGMGSLDVELSSDGGMTWDSTWTVSGDQGTDWVEASIDVSAYAATGVTVKITGTTGSTYYSDICIDAMSLVDGAQVYGCTDSIAWNYDAAATIDDGSCQYPCTDNEVTFEMMDSYGDGWNGNTYDVSIGGVSVATGGLTSGYFGTDTLCLPAGCYDVTVGGGSYPSEVSFNFASLVGAATGTYTNVSIGGANCVIAGCTDPTATNYDAAATLDDGSCLYPCLGTEVTVNMYNQYSGYSWAQGLGEAYIVVSNGTSSDTLNKSVTGASLAHVLCLADDCWDITAYDGGASYLSEYSWDVTDASGAVLASGVVNVGATSAQFATGAAACAVSGCTDPLASNYDMLATIDDSSCVYPCLLDVVTLNLYDSYGDGWNGNSLTVDGVDYTIASFSSSSESFTLCVDLSICNTATYNATGSYSSENSWDIVDASGAVIASAGDASADFGNCSVVIDGCTDSTALNFDPLANNDDGSCVYCVYGCTDSTATNYDALATCNDGSCIVAVYGCTDPVATNYYAGATIDDGSCTYAPSSCTNPSPTNAYISELIHDRARVNWDNMNDANCMVNQYRIRYREVGSSSWSSKTMAGSGLCVFGLNTASKKILGLTASTTYEYYMKAWYCGGGVSGWSAIQNFTTADECQGVINFAVTSPTTTKASFTWDTTAAYSFARIKLRPDTTGGVWTTAGGFGVFYPVLNKSKNGLTPGQTYRASSRTWCDPSGGTYRSAGWTSPIFWTQPTSIRVEGGTAINNLDVYPNPSRDIFNVSFTSEDAQDLEVRIINVVGEVVYTESLGQFVGEYTKQVDLATYTKGVYFLEITTNNGVVNKKLILQ